MPIVLNFVIGFVASFAGVVPPGLLNMSAAKISMIEGRKKALMFSLGVCVTVSLQTYIALIFAKYLDQNPSVIEVLQQVALGIFICITCYFFFIAKDTRREIPTDLEKSKTSRVLSGMFLAALNLLPLPYWVYISITFSNFGWFKFTQPELWIAVLGSAAGTFAMLALYIQFFKRNGSDTAPVKWNMNYIIGGISAIISIITAFQIFKDVF